MEDNAAPPTITPYEDGPLLVRGEVEIRTPDGTVIDPGRSTVALCRCGFSAVKPFCDGTHKVRRFRSGRAGRPAGEQHRVSEVGGSEADTVSPDTGEDGPRPS
ncbi:CDGSH iron-sulfur domain-containing protein [Amycolatopsis sp. PS_44_ISF1]|uniref:CDGSH iron-sulfur domain-containing protein n=1 Tax=Amycolatopsis sp. PS_44_ISF1 TaxID=2974917 RepID=UPI0028DF58F6|nr:CDGSH iron-sulfur domain-containing protein [Amycolatopsis sp. PS_44_ISF1]MDT8915214.1 CDGSH iron-sulfur domain-containing protein [Amycolatopsis sp. PS_44_ISF1]